MIAVAGPRIDPAMFPTHPGLEVHGYVDRLYRHLSVCDLAVVQGGSPRRWSWPRQAAVPVLPARPSLRAELPRPPPPRPLRRRPVHGLRTDRSGPPRRDHRRRTSAGRRPAATSRPTARPGCRPTHRRAHLTRREPRQARWPRSRCRASECFVRVAPARNTPMRESVAGRGRAAGGCHAGTVPLCGRAAVAAPERVRRTLRPALRRILPGLLAAVHGHVQHRVGAAHMFPGRGQWSQ